MCVCARVWLSCFLSRGHTSGVRTKTKRRSKGCHSRRPPKPRTVCAADRRSPARGRLRRGHRGPPGLRGGLKGIGGRGPLSGAVGWPRDPPPRAPSRDLSAASEPLPASRRLPLRRREAAGAGGRARPSPLRALPGEEPAGSHRARSPSPAPSGQTQPPGLGVGGGGPAGRAGASPAGSGRTGETFIPGDGEAPAATEASAAGMGPDALQLGTYGGAAAAALLLWAVCVLCRRKRYRGGGGRRGGGRPPHSFTAAPGERGCEAGAAPPSRALGRASLRPPLRAGKPYQRPPPPPPGRARRGPGGWRAAAPRCG